MSRIDRLTSSLWQMKLASDHCRVDATSLYIKDTVPESLIDASVCAFQM